MINATPNDIGIMRYPVINPSPIKNNQSPNNRRTAKRFGVNTLTWISHIKLRLGRVAMVK